jgi:lipopolysaccharide/colanic/teichoic acid biosynthesis glycosyltransferase
VRPGLTGWASIHLGYAASTGEALEKLQFDLYYIKHQSLALDLYILLRTVGAILRLKGR